MDASVVEPSVARRRLARQGPAFGILAAISVSHLLNDLIQSLLPATYPILKDAFQLDFGQIGLVTLTFQVSASLLQPVVGYYTDRRSSPYSLPAGMGFSLCGLLLLAFSSSFGSLVLAAALVGIGSSIFHPESSRVARIASGGRPGLAQSIFQLGGNAGAALGPLLVAIIVVPRGQGSIAWFSLAALLAVAVLLGVSRWYRARAAHLVLTRKEAPADAATLPRPKVAMAIVILLFLIFSKNFYTASLSNYCTFYLID